MYRHGNGEGSHKRSPPVPPAEQTTQTRQPSGSGSTTSSSASSKKHAQLTRDLYLRHTNTKILAYVDVFVDEFLGLTQVPRKQRRHVRCTLFHALDKVFRPLDSQDAKQHKEVPRLKKLDSGNCLWSTYQILIGWIVDSIKMTITLPLHRGTRLKIILSAKPSSQQRIGVEKWHRVLSKLRSMALAPPGSRGLFSQMQDYF